VLVTSSNGLIGQSIYHRLLLREKPKSDFSFIFLNRSIANLENEEDVNHVIRKFKPKIIIHNAVTLPRGKNRNRWELKNINTKVFQNILNASQDYGVSWVLAFTSYHVFPPTTELPYNLENLSLDEMAHKDWYSQYKINEISVSKSRNLNSSSMETKFLMLPHMFGIYDNFEEGKRHVIADFIVDLFQAKVENSENQVFSIDVNQELQIADALSLADFILEDYLKRIETSSFIEIFDDGIRIKLIELIYLIANLLQYNGNIEIRSPEEVRHSRSMYFRHSNSEEQMRRLHFALKEVIDSYMLRL
jgi:nucleoside-diphosphate-sugar epimerase